MPACPDCGGHLVRSHRKPIEKVLYSQCFFCKACGQRVSRLRTPLRRNVEFILSRYTRCPKCGRSDVHRGSKRDHIDSVSRQFLSGLMHRLGAPLNKCTACRLQYFDFRPVRPDTGEPPEEDVTSRTRTTASAPPPEAIDRFR